MHKNIPFYLFFLFPGLFLILLNIVILGNFLSGSARRGQTTVRVDRTTLLSPGSPYISDMADSYKVEWKWAEIQGQKAYIFEWCNKADFRKCAQNKMFTQINSFKHDESNMLKPGIWYARVYAVDELGNKSAYSGTGLSKIINPYLTPPLQVQAEAKDGKLNLSWSSCNTYGYAVYGSQKKESNSFSKLSTTNGLNFEAKMVSGFPRYFFITAMDAEGSESGASQIVEI